jgi:integrase
VVERLRQLRKWKIEQKLRRGPKFREYGLVFCGPRGRTLHQNNIRYRDHYPRLERLQLPRIRLHDLRHGHATYLIHAGVDHRTVADRLGHSSPSFTLKTYVHGVLESQRRAAEVANTFEGFWRVARESESLGNTSKVWWAVQDSNPRRPG